VIEPGQGQPLAAVVSARAPQFQQRAHTRQQAFGSSEEQWMDLDLPNLVALSYIGQASDQNPYQRDCLYPAGAELSWLADREDAVLLAWAPNHAPVAPLCRFDAARKARNTLVRVSVATEPRTGPGPG
jgi:hypothetical protein